MSFFNNLGKRGTVRLFSFIAAAFILCLGAVLHYRSQTKKLQNQMEYTYQYALNDLLDYLSGVSVSLDKSYYAGSAGQLSSLSAKIAREASAAKASISLLPINELHLENTYKFLSQVGDYALYLSRAVSQNGTLSEQERGVMQQLLEYSKNLETQVSEMIAKVGSGDLGLDSLFQAASEGAERKDPSTPSPNNGFLSLENSFEGYPALIYDGPFSDHIMQRTPRMLEDAALISSEQAIERASEIFDLPKEQITLGSEESGKMPSYGFECGNRSFSITKEGGFPVYLTNSRQVGEDRLYSVDYAFNFSRQFLNRAGFTQMRSTYYEIANGVCIINFAGTESDYTVYPDLIKVGVALDGGDLVFFDARGYLVNHTEREILPAKVTLEQATSQISPTLSVSSYKMAVIPTSGLNEVLAYEFTCTGKNGETVLVYINTQTGAEEQILILIESPSGTLTV